MVRAGAVNHPSVWEFGGYNEIQNPRRKCALIAYDKLRALLNFPTYNHLVSAHRHWVDQSLKDGCGGRDSKWTRSIAVGSKEFTERTKHLLGIKAKGRAVLSIGDTYEVREPEAGYRVDFGVEKNDIGVENAYSLNNTIDISN